MTEAHSLATNIGGVSLMALNSNWLNANDLTTGAQNMYQQNSQWYPAIYQQGYYGWSYPVYVTSPSRPIKLTLSEVEKLRKIARADKSIQEILGKFTDQIEITVDFK